MELSLSDRLDRINMMLSELVAELKPPKLESREDNLEEPPINEDIQEEPNEEPNEKKPMIRNLGQPCPVGYVPFTMVRKLKHASKEYKYFRYVGDKKLPGRKPNPKGILRRRIKELDSDTCERMLEVANESD